MWSRFSDEGESQRAVSRRSERLILPREALTNDQPGERSILQTFSDARPVLLI